MDNHFKNLTLQSFVVAADEKYDKGQAEHGGHITDRSCLQEAKNEVIDQMFYLSGVEEKIKVTINNLVSVNKNIKQVCLNMKDTIHIDDLALLNDAFSCTDATITLLKNL